MAVFQHPLVAVDGSEPSLHAAEVAIDLAALLRVPLDILSVEETLPHYVATHEETSREHAAAVAYFDALHAPLRHSAEQRGVQVQSMIRSGHEGQAVLDVLREQSSDLLILGSHGHSGVWGTFLGSTADKLVSHAPCSTLVIRTSAGKSLFRNVLVALDGSLLSWQALRVGLQLATMLRTPLHVISVVEGSRRPMLHPPEMPGSSERHAWDWTTYYQRTQKSAVAQGSHVGLTIKTTIRTGSASSTLSSFARTDNVDLLLLGATGQEHPWSPITGATARKVANEAPCAVLLIRPVVSQRHVGDVMTTKPVMTMPQTPLSEAIHQLIVQGVRLLVVVDEQRQVRGVVTLGHLLAQEDLFRRLDVEYTITTDTFEQHLHSLLATKKTVEEVMIRHPFTVRETTPIEVASQMMLTQHVTRLPVVDVENTLVGMLEQAALLRAYVEPPSSMQTDTEERKPQEREGNVFRLVGEVGQASLSHVPLVAEETPLSEILQHMQETPLRRVIVVNHAGEAVGVIGDRDLLLLQERARQRTPILAFAGRFALRLPEEFFRHRSSSLPLTARLVMRPHLFAVTPTTPLVEAVRLMLAHQIQRLVVVDEARKPLGLVDRQQLLRSLTGAEEPEA